MFSDGKYAAKSMQLKRASKTFMLQHTDHRNLYEFARLYL